MKLVETWLQGIGLHAHIGTFEAAGITTPSALAELDVSHFEALGIQNADNRRKLFFLVQRIKKELAENCTLANNASASECFVEQKQPSNKPRIENNADKKGETTDVYESRISSSASETTKRNVTQQSADGHDLEDEVLDNLLNSTDDESIAEKHNGALARENAAAALQGHSIASRKSRRLQQKQPPAASTNAASMVATRSRVTSSQLSKEAASAGAPVANSRTRATISRRSTDGAVSSGSSTDSSEPRRLSGMTAPKRRTGDSRVQAPSSMRTGKQLAAIPSNTIAPMSPLVDLPRTSKLIHRDDANGDEDDLSKRLLNRGRRRSSSFGDRTRGNVSDSDSGAGNMSDLSNKSSSRQRRRSLSDQRPPRPATRNAGKSSVVHGMDKTKMRQSLGPQSSVKEANGRPRRSLGGRAQSDLGQSSLAAFPAVTVQGTKVDDSFKAQIKRLRDDANAEHELFAESAVQDDCEMRIRVVIRKRPMSKREVAAAGDVDVIHPLDCGTYGKVLVYQPKTRVDLTKEIETLPFAFDNVFDEVSTNRQLYERCVRNLIPLLFEEEHSGVSIFAYGQTGSGKTFTMLGSSLTGIKDGSSVESFNNLGIYYMASLDIFHLIQISEYKSFSVSLSLFEIYGGKLFDLLNDRASVKCLEDQRGKVNFPGLTEHDLPNPAYLLELINLGAANRSTGSTSRNADSSRSHAIMQIHIKRPDVRGRKVEHSRLTIVDLAGSERGADTANASRATRLEGAEINTSLLALKEVIRAMATGDAMTHVPFRGSKLTQVLKESFVGKHCKSVMIGCISPNIGNCEQTLNTLRYADRVKERNSSTGEYAGRVDQPSARPVAIRSPNLTFGALLPGPDGKLVCAESNERMKIGSEEDATVSAMLEDLLSSPSNKSSPHSPHDDAVAAALGTDARAQGDFNVRRAANDLIDNHKEAMARMLDMLKDEMELVNQVDGDNDGLEGYVFRLMEMQEQQLSHIVTIREHLLRYHAARNSTSTASLNSLSDESFEDLRD
ncbi:hypothetical protein MPSEU_000601900 [Mayamaea pseudoterrestris]|nr:hypothetical protein MPSEU_000601900 [Mayamaea pseudoterrestris]